MGAMTATAADYTWFDDRFPGLAEAYCLTLVRGPSPEEMLARVRFCWIEDGDVRVTFEPLFPSHRRGSDPDALEDVMRQVGFDLSEEGDRDFTLLTGASFALAEHLTVCR